MNALLTPQELAEMLQLNSATVTRKAKKGEIPAIKIGKQFRFDREQIDKWLIQQTVGKPAYILVIDDEPVVGQLFRDSLDKNGCRVTTTLSSLEALELVARQHFDLIFLDLAMPEIDGSELFHRIRKIDKQVPVAIITGYPNSELLVKAKEQGPFIIMIKPITDDDILQAVHTFSRKSNSQ
ncbi:MAG: response regulator [Dehalococcoidia bacterium]|nr:response regulator [Dehalococcoidia bacterium]